MTSPPRRRRVAVIGAGLNGICCVKSCLEEGLQVVCFEQHDNIGGTWYYTDDVRPHQGAAAFASLTTNTSTPTMALSDFPFPDTTPLYIRHDVFLDYLHQYAAHFDLMRHIQLNTSVGRVERADDYEDTGRWNVTTSDEGTERTEIFDAVAVCTGFLRNASMPHVEGLEDFPGTVLLVKNYRTADIFKDKRVLVIGNQNSAGDVAVDSATVAKQTFLTVGRGTWLTARMPVASRPFDLACRAKQYIAGWAPPSLRNSFIHGLCMATIHMASYGLGGRPYIPNGPMIVNDLLPYQIVCGRVVVKPRLLRFNSTRAEFSDGSHEDVDIVVFATGYKSDYSFIKGCTQVPEVSQEAPPLYKWMYPIDMPHSTLSFHGATRTVGVHPPWVELQARMMARVVTGQHHLPTQADMMRDYKYRMDRLPSRHPMRLFAIEYGDELAEELGVFPSFWSMFLRSPITALRVLLTPPISLHYRLLGPGSADWAWQEADKAYYRIQTIK